MRQSHQLLYPGEVSQAIVFLTQGKFYPQNVRNTHFRICCMYHSLTMTSMVYLQAKNSFPLLPGLCLPPKAVFSKAKAICSSQPINMDVCLQSVNLYISIYISSRKQTSNHICFYFSRPVLNCLEVLW